MTFSLKDVFRLASGITFDRAEAEDVVQETLIRVWNKRDEGRSLVLSRPIA